MPHADTASAELVLAKITDAVKRLGGAEEDVDNGFTNPSIIERTAELLVGGCIRTERRRVYVNYGADMPSMLQRLGERGVWFNREVVWIKYPPHHPREFQWSCGGFEMLEVRFTTACSTFVIERELDRRGLRAATATELMHYVMSVSPRCTEQTIVALGAPGTMPDVPAFGVRLSSNQRFALQADLSVRGNRLSAPAFGATWCQLVWFLALPKDDM